MKEKFLNYILEEFDIHDFNWENACRSFYIKHFKKFPQLFYLNPRDEKYCFPITSRIDVIKTKNSIEKAFPEASIIEYEEDLYIVLHEKFIMYNIYILCDDLNIVSLIRDCIELKEPPLLSILSADLSIEKTATVTIEDVDFNPNYYNEDIPDEKINEHLQEDKKKCIILHGESGTGKTFYVKSLIKRNPNLDFYRLSSSTLYYLMDPAFSNILKINKNSVFIVECCEKEISDAKNDILRYFVFLFKGLISSDFKTKFILIFNSSTLPVSNEFFNITDLTYNFKNLPKDKCNSILKDLNKDNQVNSDTCLRDLFITSKVNNKFSKIGF